MVMLMIMITMINAVSSKINLSWLVLVLGDMSKPNDSRSLVHNDISLPHFVSLPLLSLSLSLSLSLISKERNRLEFDGTDL